MACLEAPQLTKMSLTRYVLPLLLAAFANGDAIYTNEPVVSTRAGPVRGQRNFTVGLHKSYYSFRGIPFAEPPVGNLRFEPPVPKTPWRGVLDATEDAQGCIQGSPAAGAEDCLFINVYTPKLTKWNWELLPTMVFVYGGGFEGGYSNYRLYGPDYLLDKDVVVVTFNYRLGIFGFMSTGDLVVPGNNGLKDQVLALKWVQDNIMNFGGDPHKVTVFGQSAGSAAVSYLLQSPQSRGLFHGAIMESGVTLNMWALSRHVSDLVKSIANTLQINATSSRHLVASLKAVNSTVLQSVTFDAVLQDRLINTPKDAFVFGPVVEPDHRGAFFTKKSHQLLSKGDFIKVPCIVGFNSLEGALDLPALLRLYFIRYDLDPTRFLPNDMNLEDGVRKEVGSKIKTHYFGSLPVFLSPTNLTQYFSDSQFVRPIREFVRLIHSQTPVYFYRFSYEGALWGLGNRTTHGVTHSEELGYIWRSYYSASHQDELTRTRMTTMWTNFAKTWNPTPSAKKELQNVIWKRSDENLTYLDIGDDLVLSHHPEEDHMKFWDELYKTYGHPPYDTY